MGNNKVKPIIYGKYVSEKVEGETPIIRNINAPSEGELIFKHPELKSPTLQDAILYGLKKYKDNPLIYSKFNDSYKMTYTFQQAYNAALKVGQYCFDYQLFLQKEYQNKSLKLMGIWSKNREEWLIVDLVCCLFGITLIPLYDIFGEENLIHCLEMSEISTMFISKENTIKLEQIDFQSNLQNLVLLDDDNQIQCKNLNIIRFQSLLEYEVNKVKDLPSIDPDQIFTFSFTSGATSAPKAAMITHKNMISVISQFMKNQLNANEGDRHISYLPMPHIFERAFIHICIFWGAKIYFYGGDISKLTQDMILAKPTIFIAVPRVYQKFYEKINQKFEEIKSKSFIHKFLIESAFKTKIKNAKKGIFNHTFYDLLIFKKVQKQFGGCLKRFGGGSAPIKQEIKDYLQVVLSSPFFLGYGQTENTGGLFNSDPFDNNEMSVGGITEAAEFKLVDVPELEYFTDSEKPRGEIYSRGAQIFFGYYKDQEKTKETMQGDWLKSGDIGELDPKTFQLKIIDRKKNIFKLSQGEYVAPDRVENLLKGQAIQDIFLYGDSFQSYCIAFIQINEEYLINISKQLHLSENIKDLIKNEDVIKKYKELIQLTGQQLKLQSYEIPHKIVLLQTPFLELNILSSTLKLQRNKAYELFKAQIRELYAKGY